MAADTAWLDSLKPGDQVMVESRLRESFSQFHESRAVVRRRTPKRIVIGSPWSDAVEWTIDGGDGHLVGGRYRGEIRPISAADREREAREKLKRKIDTWHDALTRDPSKVSTATLRAVANAIGEVSTDG